MEEKKTNQKGEEGSVSFLNVSEAASFLRCKKSAIYYLVFKKQIPHYKRPGSNRLLFKKEELEQWVFSNPFPVKE